MVKIKKRICKIDGCESISRYKKLCVCRKHYMRLRRNGHYNIKDINIKTLTPYGYYTIRPKSHPLLNSGGYVYEHRYVYYEQVSKIITECELCLTELTWDTVHIDHIDENKTNNDKKNLRPLCRKCNISRSTLNVDPVSQAESDKHVQELMNSFGK